MEVFYNAAYAECYGKTYIDARGVLRVREHKGDYVVLRNVDFGKGRRGFKVSSYRGAIGGSLVEARLDSLDGELIGVCTCSYMDFDQLHTAWCEIKETKGTHDVYLKFTVPNGYRSFQFTVASPYDTKGYCPIPDSKIIDVESDTWEATDMLGRKIISPEECPDRRNREVGMFYWIWHENNSKHNPTSVTETLGKYPEAEYDKNHYTWDIFHAHWTEPLFGYYRNSDPYVIRKHMIMLANAGVDYISFDTTNGGYMHKEAITSLFEGMRLAKNDGVKVPKFLFIMGFGPNINTYLLLRALYQDIYKPGLYEDLWYKLDGKPVVMAFPNALDVEGAFGDVDDKFIDEIREFFTFRPPQARYDLGTTFPNQWSWLQEYPQHKFCEREDGSCEMMSVGASQNKTDDHPYSRYNIPGAYGRSFTKKDRWDKLTPDSYLQGYNFKEQWDYAIEQDPDRIFVSGWNEWTIGRFTHREYIYESEAGSTQVAFVDEFSPELSRDLEPDKEYYLDTYYLLLCHFVRQYKGTAKLPQASAKQTIDINKGKDQWENVVPIYKNHKGSAPRRDYPGFGKVRYVNRTGRNDIIESRVARDDKFIYFSATCVADIVDTDKENCMTLFLNTDRDYWNGWEGYNYRIVKNELQKFIDSSRNGGFNWEKVADIEKTIDGNFVQIKLDKSLISLGEDFDIEFKWSDNNFPEGRVKTPCAMDFYENGVSAPFGRFNYRYKTK